jgi:N-acetylmuramoyl-L-alanine amidase
MNQRSKLTNRAVLWGLLLAVGLFAAFTPVPPSMVVVIDAGHGGEDPGNLGTGRYKVTEKHVTLDVATRLKKLIQERHPDVKIVMTRTGDTFPTLKERVRIANESQADLFISVHCDAFTKPTAIGSSTFVMGMHKSEESMRVAMQENAAMFREKDYENRYDGFDPNDPDTYIALALRESVFLNQSLEFGAMVQSQFRDRVGRVDRGVRQAGYYVIAFTNMPSALIELGFLTHAAEEDFLISEQGKEYMSSAIYRAFKDYKAKYHAPKTAGSSASAPEKPSTTGAGESRDSRTLSAGAGPIYRVQILASATRIPSSDPRFAGQSEVVEYLRDGLYKYAVGAATTPEAAEKLKKSLRENGFPGAFVVAFQGDVPIPLDAKTKTGN